MLIMHLVLKQALEQTRSEYSQINQERDTLQKALDQAQGGLRGRPAPAYNPFGVIGGQNRTGDLAAQVQAENEQLKSTLRNYGMSF